MIAIEIPEKNKFLYMPENLAECDAKQYADFSKLLWMAQEKQISYDQLCYMAVYPLLNLRKSKKKSPEKYENIIRLSEYIDNFFDKDEDGNFTGIKLEFTKNYLPKYRLFYSYYGPDDGFSDVIFGQYIDGLDEYIYYSKTGDIKSLRMLFSIFYLKKNEVYNYRVSKKRAEGIFRYVDIRHLYGFFLFFSSMQSFVLQGEIMVMGNSIDLSIIFQPDSGGFESTIPGTGFRNIITDMAATQVFGPYKGVEKTNLWVVLIRLYELKKKELDDKEKNKTNDSTRA
ncbi:hypothetical protein [Chryseobacterium vrystaatense]|uniref:Uncharacterized protein n=1 Tax=Chryseobacterium vrystaatense TaxID=307480 RepID=A0ABR4UJ49_9FLAO|nr:hypothetical protein [Chryseobacterium vrystaatense]KFF24760.1 hypothetical protein IW16_17650 [Chryseobacterium vrystaatense]